MTKYRIKELLVCILLFFTGLVSPNDGVDEGVKHEPLQMLLETILIVMAGVLLLIMLRKFTVAKSTIKKLAEKEFYQSTYF
jgi:hypothetical protein